MVNTPSIQLCEEWSVPIWMLMEDRYLQCGIPWSAWNGRTWSRPQKFPDMLAEELFRCISAVMVLPAQSRRQATAANE